MLSLEKKNFIRKLSKSQSIAKSSNFFPGMQKKKILPGFHLPEDVE